MTQNWKALYDRKDSCEPEDDSAYSSISMDHFEHPRNIGRVEKYHGMGSFGDPSCGDSLEMTIRINDEDIITDVGYLVYGCAGAIATSSMVSELVKGKHIRAALKVTAQDVINALGKFPEQKVHCSLMGLEALKLAVADALYGRQLIKDGQLEDYDQYRAKRQDGKIRFELRPVENKEGSK